MDLPGRWHIIRRVDLWIRARIVEMDVAIFVYRHRKIDTNRNIRDGVVFEIIRERISTGFECPENLARLELRVSQKVFHHRAHFLDTVAFRECFELLGGNVKAGAQSLDVTPHLLWDAHVVHHDCSDIVVHFAAAIELQRRDAKSLLKSVRESRARYCPGPSRPCRRSG